MIEEQITIAARTRETLINQRTAFKALQTQLTTLASKYSYTFRGHRVNTPYLTDRFPMIGSVIHRINIRKRKDSIVLGSLIGFCTFLLLLYLF